MADRFFDDRAKPTFKAKTSSTSSPTGNRNMFRPDGRPCLCDIARDLLESELRRSVPQYSNDKGPTVILESRYGDPGELQCMATLLDALGVPLRHAVDRMWYDSQSGHIIVTVGSSSIFLATIIAGQLDHALGAYNVAHDGFPGNMGLTVAHSDEHLACV
jgi:hypothetical protein